MNTVLANFKSESLRRIFILWSAWIALGAAGIHLNEWALVVATGGCFFTDAFGKLAPPKPPEAQKPPAPTPGT